MVPTHPPKATSPNHPGTVWWWTMPCHKAKVITKWLGEQSIDILGPCPGNSPDLNPIENLWSILKRRVDNQNPTNSDKLQALITQEWAAISQDVAQKLIDTDCHWADVECLLWRTLKSMPYSYSTTSVHVALLLLCMLLFFSSHPLVNMFPICHSTHKNTAVSRLCKCHANWTV